MPQPELLNSAEEATNSVTHGIEKVWAYDNIAIIVLMIIVLLSFAANTVQFFSYGKRQDKALDRDILMATAINGLESAVDDMKASFALVIQLYKTSKDT